MRKRISILINSLAGGGAERQVSLLTKYLNIDKVILLENDINYNIHSNIKVLTNHTGKTSSVLKTLYIPIHALKLKKFISNNIIISFLERSNFVNMRSKLVKKHK
ncbi:MAG TPA: glycosyltransferase, partial [Candidatus Desulfofervidus auxilii]|nr:glycosyltransferase [Candidatus Desulfofervidus auxilii]